MIILRGADFECEVNSITTGYDKYYDDCVDYEIEVLTGTYVKIDSAILNKIFNSIYNESIGLNIGDLEDYPFSYTCDIDNNILIIDCININLKMIQNDNCDIEIIGEVKNIVNKKLSIKYRHLSYKDFKSKFNLKGTKKQFIENCPDGFYLDEQNGRCNKLYILNKDVVYPGYVLNYSCQL